MKCPNCGEPDPTPEPDSCWNCNYNLVRGAELMKRFIFLSLFGVGAGALFYFEFASGGVESRHANAETSQLLDVSGSSAPPAGNSFPTTCDGTAFDEPGPGSESRQRQAVASEDLRSYATPPLPKARPAQQTQPEPDPEWAPNPDRPLRPQLTIYAENEPEKAAALALRMTPTEEDGDEAVSNDPLGTVMRVWAQANPYAATAFYDKLTDPQRQLGAAIGLIDGLAAHDVERAAAWVEQRVQHPDVMAFISLLVPHMESKRAERWIASLPLDENARELTRGLVASRPRAVVELEAK